MKIRLDNLLVDRKMVESRSQAESYIKLGKVAVDGIKRTKPGFFVDVNSELKILQQVQYVSRAGLKLESVAKKMRIDFRNKTVLDVGSSTGGFTDYSLKNGANKVIAVDVGTDQLHPKLRLNKKVELHEKTDIRNFKTDQKIDVVVIDVSFISIKEILPSVVNLSNKNTKIVAMVKPQFEAGRNGTVNGVVKNNSYRRKILQDFENWCRSNNLYIENKRDSEVKGTKGNQERFYILRKTSK
ncbi:MAG: TlyA family RNA methyltransferase [Candidatus Nanogingivalaceae bacterium]|jgi:ftsJ-like methyltransferase|nr:MAG: TlyA family RNA methyltransferase [Candidatus Nanogingivalaceae bacterium]QWB91663.1 MAG: TlyA family RNA methyltransferase [Candidatus Nanogingivalaceae bacterium]